MSVSREIVTRERHTRVTESSNSCFLRYITSVFNNPALWDFSVDTFGLSRITHAGRFTHSRRKKWVFTNSRMKFLLFTHHAWMSFHEFTQQKKGFHDFTQRKKAFHAITQPYGGASSTLKRPQMAPVFGTEETVYPLRENHLPIYHINSRRHVSPNINMI